MTDTQDLPVKRAVLASLERRWAKSDQSAFIAAVLLNPFTRNEPLVKTNTFTTASITNLLRTLWKRFYGTESPPELASQIRQYLGKTGLFQNLDDELTSLRGEAEIDVSV